MRFDDTGGGPRAVTAPAALPPFPFSSGEEPLHLCVSIGGP